MAKYKLGICEIYNPTCHMSERQRTFTYSVMNDYYNSKNIQPRLRYMQPMIEIFMLLNNFMVIYEFDRDCIFNGEAEIYRQEATQYIRSLVNTHRGRLSHLFIRNYDDIVIRDNYIKIDIIDSYELDSGEMMCSIKTVWLRIFQRKWRKYYNAQQKLIAKRKNPRTLFNRSIYGKWTV